MTDIATPLGIQIVDHVVIGASRMAFSFAGDREIAFGATALEPSTPRSAK